MGENEYKIFNITKKRPKVLFLGNGLFYNECSWDDFIDDCRCEGIHKDDWDKHKHQIPYTIRAGIACDVKDTNRWNNYKQKTDELKNKKIYQLEHPLLDQLLALPFDAILTTNYTYQIENALNGQFVNRSDRYIQTHYSYCTKDKETSRYLLHSYNRINSHDIWHIHGEARRKSSMVLTHDEYGRLTAEVRKVIKETSNNYEKYQTNLKMKSWVDYFLMGDVYSLGYGADFSEFVFWWMIERRKREVAPVGNFTFYEPEDHRETKNNTAKLFALSASKMNVETLGCTINDKAQDFNAFYKKAIADIKDKIKMEN